MQRAFYQGLLAKNYDVLTGNRARTLALNNLLMQLRKCANHPYLFPGVEPKADSEEEEVRHLLEASGKLLLVDKLLDKVSPTARPLPLSLVPSQRHPDSPVATPSPSSSGKAIAF
jgi:SNF2 family DNA or RNA helicase